MYLYRFNNGNISLANLIKEDVKKKSISCPYDHNSSYLQINMPIINKICTLLPLNNMLLNNMLLKVYRNFQRGITLQIFGAL